MPSGSPSNLLLMDFEYDADRGLVSTERGLVIVECGVALFERGLIMVDMASGRCDHNNGCLNGRLLWPGVRASTEAI